MLSKKYRFPYKNLHKIVAQSPIKSFGKFGSARVMKPDSSLNIHGYKFAIIVNKKLGDAVKRNKHKRRLRSILYKKYKNEKTPLLIMYISKEIPASFDDLQQDVIETVDSAISLINND